MSFGARTTWPPKAWPRAWWPRQTPRSGTGERRMSSRLMPASSGVPGPGEITIRSGRERERVLDAHRVVADHLHLRPQLAEVLVEVEGERVVVVDEEDHARPPATRERLEEGLRLRLRLALLVRRGRSRPRCPAPACSVALPPAQDEGADRDAEVEVAAQVDVAERPAVEAAQGQGAPIRAAGSQCRND